MGYCVYIDLGDGDFIKPNFSKPPTNEQIEQAKQSFLLLKARMKEGWCFACDGQKTRRVRDLDAPGFKLIDKPCPHCGGTGREPAKTKEGGLG